MNELLETVVMSSENDFQELQFSANSSIRGKVDVLNPRENGSYQEHALADSKYNSRTSLAWDSAFFTSPGVFEPEELFLNLNSNNLDILGKDEHLWLSSQSLEPNTNSKVGKVNYRKSLAWDNSFFTSEGVLNPFELAIVNNSYKKCESHLLPVIEDDKKVWRSMESNSTLDNEGFSLTRLEMDLFEDMRASIPKTTTSFELGRGKASGKQDGSCTKIKGIPTNRNQSTYKHGSKKITRQMSDAPKIQPMTGTEIRKHYQSSIKPPKASDQVNYTSRGSTKRSSLGEKQPKLKSGLSASAESSGKSKKPCLRDTNKSESCRTSIIGISPTNLRRNENSQVLNLRASSPASVTPLAKKTRANKTEVENSCQSAYLQSTPTNSSFESPSSSIDKWSSKSSSSISSALRFVRHKPCLHTPGSYRLEVNSHGRHGNSENQSHKKAINKIGNTKISSASRDVKPSGLRMPSPKLGFFDAENMLALAMLEASPNRSAIVNSKGSANQTRCSELESLESLSGSGSKKLGHCKNGGMPISVLATRRISNKRDCLDVGELGSQRIGSANRKSYGRILQCSNNQYPKVTEAIVKHPEFDFQMFQEDKENVTSFADQIEGLTKHVNSIDINSNAISHSNEQKRSLS